MKKTTASDVFVRRANTLPLIFRLSFLHSLYGLPGWFIIRDFTKESITGVIATVFSVFILLTVIQIRLRALINRRTENLVNRAIRETVSNTGSRSIEIRQSFSLRDYLKLNAEVMFSYLRPWLTLVSGAAFIVLFILSLYWNTGIVKSGLAAVLALYFLVFPWLMFLSRTAKVYKKGKPFLDNQVIAITDNGVRVSAGESPERTISEFRDIAVTLTYLLLYIAGSNYLQIKRRKIDSSDEADILRIAHRMLSQSQ